VSGRTLGLAAAGVAAAGAVVASYLLLVRSGSAELVCRTGGCETVQSSSYAELLGVPVAALGLLAFVTIGVLALLASPLARAAAVSLSLAAVAFSAYLLVVQLTVIGELCDWCLLSDALLTLLTVLVLLRVAREPAATSESRGTSRSRVSAPPPRSRRPGRASRRLGRSAS
jgi:uncharacterized membrane protein